MLEKLQFIFEYLIKDSFSYNSIKYVNSLDLNSEELKILTYKIIKTNSPILMYEFALFITGAPIDILVNSIIKTNNMKFISKFSKNIIKQDGAKKTTNLLNLDEEEEQLIIKSFKCNGLFATITEYNIINSKNQIVGFLTRNPDNLQLLQIYYLFFEKDLPIEKLNRLDLECINYYCQIKNTKKI